MSQIGRPTSRSRASGSSAGQSMIERLVTVMGVEQHSAKRRLVRLAAGTIGPGCGSRPHPGSVDRRPRPSYHSASASLYPLSSPTCHVRHQRSSRTHPEPWSFHAGEPELSLTCRIRLPYIAASARERCRNRSRRREAHLPAKQARSQAAPRVPSADGDRRRPPCNRSAAGQGPQTSVRLRRRSGLLDPGSREFRGRQPCNTQDPRRFPAGRGRSPPSGHARSDLAGCAAGTRFGGQRCLCASGSPPAAKSATQ